MSGEFYAVLQEKARAHPDKPAVIDGASVLSYRDLLEQVDRFAGGLAQLASSPSSKLGILCVNQKESVIAVLGALRAGVPAIPINPLLSAEDLVFVVKDAGIDILLVNGLFIKPETAAFGRLFPHVIVTPPCPPEELRAPQARLFEDFMASAPEFSARHERDGGLPDVLLYTSGTTARSKGVMLEEEQFWQNTGAFLGHLGFGPDERCIVALPMFHSFGNIMILTILRAGGTLILLPQFQPKTILAKIAEHRATLLPLVPTIYSFLVDLVARGGHDVSSLRLCISGGASLPQSLLHRVESALGVTVLEGYGLTETTPVISVNHIRDGSVPGSVGPVLSNVELRVVDEAGKDVPQGSVGEIWVRGPTVMKGYWNRPDENRAVFADGGWLRTGDLGQVDEKGRLYISAGRIKDLIIRAGENISPLAIENAVMDHPGVTEVSAVGVPDPRAGERVRLCVVRRPGTDTSEADIKSFCREKLPAHMIPDEIRFYDAFPKTATGKVIKSELRS